MDKGHREALRDAARTLMREKGLSRTTARDLVRVSGTNLRSIGYHFGSKDALMAEVLALITAEWTAAPVAASRADAGSTAPADRMTNAVRTMLTDLPGKREDLSVYLEGLIEARHSPELSASLIQTQQDARTAIAESIQEGAPAVDPAVTIMLARLLMAVHDGLALQCLVNDTPELRDVESLMAALAGLGLTVAAGLEVPGASDILQPLLEG